jgi:hypothetical protein
VHDLSFCELPTVQGLTITIINYSREVVKFHFIQREPCLKLISSVFAEPGETATLNPKLYFMEGTVNAVDCHGYFLAGATIQIRDLSTTLVFPSTDFQEKLYWKEYC